MRQILLLAVFDVHLRFQRERRRLAAILLVVPIALWPAAAAADTGVPMLAVLWPLSWFAFPIIVLIEAIVAKYVLELSAKDSLLLALSANAWSTFIGIPLAWLACLVVEIFAGVLFGAAGLRPNGIGQLLAAPFFAAWLPPFGGAEKTWWVYAAAALLCVPSFLASVYIETRVASRRVPEESARRWARRANGLTYGLAVLALVVAAVVSASRSR